MWIKQNSKNKFNSQFMNVSFTMISILGNLMQEMTATKCKLTDTSDKHSPFQLFILYFEEEKPVKQISYV